MYKLRYEAEYCKNGRLVGGVDEAGRGPLAGPVVAACVVIDSNFVVKNNKLKAVNDSKKVSPKLREELFEIIMSEFPLVGIGVSTNTEVDKYNVLQATFLAMRRAIKDVKAQANTLLIDGRDVLPALNTKQVAVIKGDAKVFVIAAASIIAKVSRDRIMHNFHRKYPEYGFETHKGYGTKKHLANLREYGPCKIHRLSYAPVAEVSRIKTLR